MNKILIIIALVWIGVGCSPTKRAQRHIRQAYEHIDKAKKLDPSIKTTTAVDTVEVPVITKEVKTDTMFVSKPGDTVVIEKDKLRIKYVSLPNDTVYLEGECLPDTVFVKVPVIKETFIKQESYRSLVKRIFGLNNIEFWIMHLIIVVALLMIVYAKLIRPNITVKSGN